MAIKRPTQCDTDNVAAAQFWASPLGQQTLTLEKIALAPFIRRFHGDSILWVGTQAASANALQRCMVRNSFFLQQDPGGETDEIPSLTSQLEALPFKSNSLDGVVLHHALECTVDPRVALREVTRVLVPGGRVVICGFNPLSLVGVRRLYARFIEDALSGNRLINPLRLFDWLTLLGYELDGKPLYCGYALPFARLANRFDMTWLEERERHADHERHAEPSVTVPFGSLLLVDAVKHALPMRPQWRGKKERGRLAPVAYPRVASWQRTKS